MRLSLLYTCRRIYAETLAYAPTFFVTNRWHRNDLQEIQHYLEYYQALSTHLNADPITFTSLTLVTDKRRPHLNSSGAHEYLDSGGDYAMFVWNVVELFLSVEKVEIETGQRVGVLAPRLFLCLIKDTGRIDGEKGPGNKTKAWRALEGTNSDGQECIWLEESELLGGSWRRVRRVEVTCKYRPSKDSFYHSKIWYL